MSEPTTTPPEGGPVIRDKRRVDPLTGQVRQPAEAPPAAEGRSGAEVPTSAVSEVLAGAVVEADLAALEAEASAYKADLQRVHAEYANYRKRVERDRDLVREQAVAAALTDLLPVLDDIGRAREHGELEGGFRSVGEALENVVARLGLERYGTPGEPFDPTVHEALTHTVSEDVAEAVCVEVYQPGYRYAGRVVRPARVGVAEPA